MNRQHLIEEIQKQTVRLDKYDDLDALVEAVGDAKYVMLGEASHGTSEFYTMRAALSKRLIEKKGFNLLAVEGDWPSCYTLNRYIKGYPGTPDNARDALQDFNRWPTWMWANQEIVELAEWMKQYNAKREGKTKAGFYGIDVYSLWESMEEIIRYLKETGSPELEQAKKAFSCFEPYGRSEQNYAVQTAFFTATCEDEVVKLLLDLQKKRKQHPHDDEAALSLELNALAAADAERYYRAMVQSGSESWNIRDRHMVQALDRVMDFYGDGAKAIIWEHNTHIGDARATDMARDGMVNVGQLLREQHPAEDVYAVGFGTHRGTVLAARAWGDPMETMTVPRAQEGSWEDLMHRAGEGNKLLFLGSENPHFQEEIGHRAIGVVYHPEYEHLGNYVPSKMAQRYDAFIYVEKTRALQALEVQRVFV